MEEGAFIRLILRSEDADGRSSERPTGILPAVARRRRANPPSARCHGDRPVSNLSLDDGAIAVGHREARSSTAAVGGDGRGREPGGRGPDSVAALLGALPSGQGRARRSRLHRCRDPPGDLRAADRQDGRASAGRPISGGPRPAVRDADRTFLEVLVRGRFGRPRRLLARPLRRAGLTGSCAHRDRSGSRARRHVRDDLRLLPRPDRHAHLACDRRDARVPGPAPRARDRLGLLARERLRPRTDQTWPVDGRGSDRDHQLDVHRPDHPRPGPLTPREGVRRSRAGARRERPDDPLPRDPPDLVAPIVVYTTLVIPQNILLEAALSYLGVGINPPQASWGEMIAEATPIFNTAWWFFAFPGAALLLTVLAFNLVGDGVRDALDPRTAV